MRKKVRYSHLILMWIFFATSCGWAEDDKIISGSSIAGLKIGSVYDQDTLNRIRISYQEKGIYFSTEKGKQITSITTDQKKYRLNGSLGIGSTFDEMIQHLGNPILINGEKPNIIPKDKKFTGYVSYSGLTLGFKESRIVMITVIGSEMKP